MTRRHASRLASFNAPVTPKPAPAPHPFLLHASARTETAATIAARRALMSRKGISVDEMNQRVRDRQRQMRQRRRPHWLEAALGLAMLSGLALAWWGSARDWQPLLLGGYAVSGLGLVALIARLSHRPAASLRRPELDYLPDEQLASAEDIALLRRLALADAEIEIATAAWWRHPAPIRKGDVKLALDVQRAKLG